MAENRTINGITFSTEEEYLHAKKELEKIDYVNANNDMSNDQTVLALYNKFVWKNIFRTQIGYNFLKELQERLVHSENIDKSKIARLPISDFEDNGVSYSEVTKERNAQTERISANRAAFVIKKEPSGESGNSNLTGNKSSRQLDGIFHEVSNKVKNKSELDIVKGKYKWSVFINIVLVAAIIIMVYITLNSNHVNIINYETKLQDKYASWAQELLEKEEELNRLYRELN